MYGEKLIVYKFGGTVLQNENLVLKEIKDVLEEESKIIVVVSAIGRYPMPYSTDTFYNMSKCATEKEICRMVSCGEIISSIYLSNYLRMNHIKAISVSIQEIKLEYDDGFKMNNKIEEYFMEYDVVIVPGFIGLKNDEITLLPRGGSNITASFLASHFKCNLVIFTDVDGLYYEDPKVVKGEDRIRVASYDTLKNIALKNPNFFPILGIHYLENTNVDVIIRSLDSKIGTIIRKI